MTGTLTVFESDLTQTDDLKGDTKLHGEMENYSITITEDANTVRGVSYILNFRSKIPFALSKGFPN
jgi:hypothetical protein